MADDLDAVIDAVAAIEDASGQATHIVGSPQSWADLSKVKQADNSNVSLVGAGTTAPSRTPGSLPVHVNGTTSHMPRALRICCGRCAVRATATSGSSHR